MTILSTNVESDIYLNVVDALAKQANIIPSEINLTGKILWKGIQRYCTAVGD